ncbi:hypothetical protein J5I95_24675 [Candidatus Poribacteria bacterium]|nr:hypothetical protein [Candidatus Poribacteria bacterium]
MLKYTRIKPRVYIESTVVSYLVARPSSNPILASRQKASQQLWEDYADRFEFVISDIVSNQAAGFQPTTICTPVELMEETQMQETPEKHPEFDPETYTDPILEECYRIKAEISAQFKKPGELYAYLKAMQEENKRNGIKYVSYYDPSKHTPSEKSEDDD